MSTASFFTPENADLSKRKEHLSPSGKYKLVVTPYATKKGCWNYTQGLIYRVGEDTPIAEIQRNYAAFPFLFIEDHQNGHSYLIGGENYQGQTVVELDTGKVVNNLSHGADKGHGFCWASYRYEAAAQVLVVDGCYWACPYQFKLFDFSDPMGKGWPEIGADVCIDGDSRQPGFNDDGTITCFDSNYYESDDEDEKKTEDEESEYEPLEPGLRMITVYRREDLKLVKISEWVSDKEKKRRADSERHQKAYNEWLTNFRATDPLYHEMVVQLKDSTFKAADSYESVGGTFADWCPDWTGNERRMCKRILGKTATQPYTVDLEWATDTGPIKLVSYKSGQASETKFFMEHSVESIRAAFAYAKNLAIGATS